MLCCELVPPQKILGICTCMLISWSLKMVIFLRHLNVYSEIKKYEGHLFAMSAGCQTNREMEQISRDSTRECLIHNTVMAKHMAAIIPPNRSKMYTATNIGARCPNSQRSPLIYLFGHIHICFGHLNLYLLGTVLFVGLALLLFEYLNSYLFNSIFCAPSIVCLVIFGLLSG